MGDSARTHRRGLARRWALLMGLALISMWALLPGAAGAWKSWTGEEDPIILLSTGETVNIAIQWDLAAGCPTGPVTVDVTVPAGVSGTVTYEEDNPCITTQTTVQAGNYQADRLHVQTTVPADGNYMVLVTVSVDGTEVAALRGRTNKVVQGSANY